MDIGRGGWPHDAIFVLGHREWARFVVWDRFDRFYSVILSDRRAIRAGFGAARWESKDPLFSKVNQRGASHNAVFVVRGA
jgi:hypothetical protein